MPHELHSIDISEVSLVDNPANAEIDPRTGRKIKRAVVALYKRDIPEPLIEELKREKREMSNFQKILKSATTRDEIVLAVEEKAQEIAKRDGIRAELAMAKAWSEYPEAHLAYEMAAKAAPKLFEPKTMRVTPAEKLLDNAARKRVRKTGETYSKAYGNVLTANPDLYTQHLNELAAGTFESVPDSRPGSPIVKAAEEDDGECPECGEEIDDDDNFCGDCGADLTKARAKAKAKAKSKA